MAFYNVCCWVLLLTELHLSLTSARSVLGASRGFTVPRDFRFVSLLRDDTDLTIMYESSTKPAVFLNHPYGHYIEHEFGALNLAVSELDMFSTVLFILEDSSITLSLRESLESQSVVPNIQLHFNQGPDVTYTRGDDLGLKVTMTSDEPSMHVSSSFVNMFFDDGVTSAIDNNRVYSVIPNYVPRDDPVNGPLKLTLGSNTSIQANISMDAANRKGVIVFDVTTDVPCPNRNCLAGSISVSAFLTFHQSGEGDISPPGSMVFAVNEHNRDWSRVSCYEGTYCVLSCCVVGSSANFDRTVKISRTGQDGVLETLSGESTSQLFGLITQTDVILHEVSWSDAGLYRCSAQSQSTVIEIDITLEVV